MKFSITSSIFDVCPKITIGFLRAEGLVPRADADVIVSQMLGAEVERLRARFPDAGALDLDPGIAGWRTTYSKLGMKVRSYRPTHDALARRYLKGAELFRVTPLVDVYLANQLAHLLPHGGYDLAHVEGDVVLDRSPGSETFAPLGGAEETTDAGEVVYRDSARVLTRRWNYRDCDFAKITSETVNALLCVEAEDPAIPESAVASCLDGLADRIKRVFVGDTTPFTFVFTASNPSASF